MTDYKHIGVVGVAPVGPKERDDVVGVYEVMEDGTATGRFVVRDEHLGNMDVTIRGLTAEFITRGGFSSAQDKAGTRRFILTEEQKNAAWRSKRRFDLPALCRHYATERAEAAALFFEALRTQVSAQ